MTDSDTLFSFFEFSAFFVVIPPSRLPRLRVERINWLAGYGEDLAGFRARSDVPSTHRLSTISSRGMAGMPKS
jgi:hypothetical protein